MKKIIDKLFTFLIQSKEYIRNDSGYIAQFNMQMLRFMSIGYLACIVGYFAVVCTIQRNTVQSAATGVAFVLQLVLIAYIQLRLKKDSSYTKAIEHTCYVFAALIMALAIVIDVLAFRNRNAVLFPVLLILLGQIYTLEPLKILRTVSAYTALFVALAFIFKNSDIVFNDCISALVACGVAVAANWSLTLFKIKEYEIRTKYQIMTYKDPMTGCLNKVSFKENCVHRISSRQQHAPSSPYAVVVIDLDNFKAINETLGHLFADKILIEFSGELNKYFESIPNDVFIGRFGGDEFEIFVRKVRSPEYIKTIIADLLKYECRILSDRIGLDITFTAGIAVSDTPNEPFDSVFEKADFALRHCKRTDKSGCMLYNEIEVREKFKQSL